MKQTTTLSWVLIFIVLAILILSSSLSAEALPGTALPELTILRSVYPDVSFSADYDSRVEDWRIVIESGGRSFHSMGLAIDFLPKELQGKSIYWLWEKNGGNDQWMLTPLDQRWMPPERVIDAFESEGFIWGGKWAVWDNMHFEYRPELLAARDRRAEGL